MSNTGTGMEAFDEAFHYPPDVLNLLVDTIPRLFKAKRDVILFFRGAGVPEPLLREWETKLRSDPTSVGKFPMTRDVLRKLNEAGDPLLRQRREVIKRVAEFEDYSRCWPNDRLEAEALVGRVRLLVDKKDSFTRMKHEREKERKERLAEKQAQAEAREKQLQERAAIRDELFSLFGEADPHKRGKALEGVLNRLFATYGMLVRDSFTLKGHAGEGVVEQIDGVVNIDGEIYLVEMKWQKDPIGPGEVGHHLTRVIGRGEARGIFISESEFSAAAQQTAREALRDAVVVLCRLHEIVFALENGVDLKNLFRDKAHDAIVEKRVTGEGGA